jgi:glycosyltransferase involved in cell wall biosynthesis
MIGKALINAGNNFSLYTNTLSHNPFNNESKGVHNNIPFEYLHGTTSLEIGKMHKLFLYINGILALQRKLRKMSPSTDVVYIYAHGNVFNVITVTLCRIYGIKVVQEINEWDYEEEKAPFKKAIFHNTIARKSDGAIAISRNIRDTVHTINPEMPIITIPVLEDPADYETSAAGENQVPYCFWMGLVNAYIDDVLLIIEACAGAYKQNYVFDLRISGPCSSDSRAKITGKARESGFPEDRLYILGYISEEEISRYCRNAAFFIIPMWNNKKSTHRLPTKLASFMFCGKPVITCRIGEVGEMLSDRETALFFEPGNAGDLVDKITILLNDTTLYNELCRKSRAFAHECFSYAAYENALNQFFVSIAGLNKAPAGQRINTYIE